MGYGNHGTTDLEHDADVVAHVGGDAPSLPASPGSAESTAYLLQEEKDGTRLTITNSGYELLPEDARWSTMEQNAFGFGMMLENLRASVESNDLPSPGGF